MINLFREIRRKFLAEKSFNKYLLYALGEIFLVVIGILIALQVNNWNEGRKNVEKERLILQALNKEFVKNLELFEAAKKIHISSQKSAEKLMTFLNSSEPPDIFLEENINMYKDAVEGHTYNPSSGLVNSLISSGNYQLIRNDTLQNLVISWNDVLLDYLEEEQAAGDFWTTRFEPFMIQEGMFATNDVGKVIEVFQSPVHKSLVARRLLYVGNIVEAIEKEPIERYLKDIVRITSAELSGE